MHSIITVRLSTRVLLQGLRTSSTRMLKWKTMETRATIRTQLGDGIAKIHSLLAGHRLVRVQLWVSVGRMAF